MARNNWREHKKKIWWENNQFMCWFKNKNSLNFKKGTFRHFFHFKFLTLGTEIKWWHFFLPKKISCLGFRVKKIANFRINEKINDFNEIPMADFFLYPETPPKCIYKEKKIKKHDLNRTKCFLECQKFQKSPPKSNI